MAKSVSTFPRRHRADPLPLGLGALALTLFLYSVKNTGWMGSNHSDIWLAAALFYGGLGQFMAGVWELRRGNTFLMTLFVSLAAFWMGMSILSFFPAASGLALPPTPEDPNLPLSFLFFSWMILSAILTLAALRTNLVLLLLSLALTLTFLFLWWGRLLDQPAGIGMTITGGYLGIVTAAIGWYGTLAGVVNATWKKRIVPVVPLSKDQEPSY